MSRWINRFWTRDVGRVQSQVRRHSTRLMVQALEDRTVPATFMVMNTLDSGAGSLRQAILDANAAPGADVVAFSSLFENAQTITLTTGQLTVSAAVTVTGPGAALLTISGNKQSRIFDISSAPVAAAISLAGLTLAQGQASPPNPNGGAIFGRNQELSLANCNLTGNRSSPSGVGGAIAMFQGGALGVTDCLFTNNVGVLAGAAIYIEGTNGHIIAERCTLRSNGGSEGCIFAAGYLLVTNCIISDNQASAVLFANSAASSEVVIRNSTFSNNLANGSGGGISLQNHIGTFVVENSSISQNTTANEGGGIGVAGAPPAVFIVRNSTVAFNKAGFTGGGIAWMQGVTAGEISLQSSVVAKNTGGVAPDISCPRVLASNSSIFSASGISTFTDLGGNRPFGEDPLLGPLQFNGGPTQTHALLAGSPCIDTGSNPANLTTDQRGNGFLRLFGTAVDIGAFEVQPPSALAMVGSVTINNGSVQRSRVANLTIAFDQLVSLPANPADAFQLKRQSDDGLVGLSASMVPGPTTVVTLTFTDGPVEHQSLADGRYTLTIDANKVSSPLGQLDGNGDGTGGDNYVLASAAAPDPPTNIFRFFGDSDGNGATDAADFLVFRESVGLKTGDVGFNAAFDFDADGDVDAFDFLHFRDRIGTSV